MIKTIKATNIAKIVCRITANTQGSGVVYRYNPDTLLLFTCIHVIRDSRELQIHFGGDTQSIKLDLEKEAELMLDKKNDAAIIKLSIHCHVMFNNIPFVMAMIDEDGDDKLLCGYPEVLNRDKIMCSTLDKGRSCNKSFRTSINLDTYTSEGSENVRGFSGGGVFSNFNGSAYLEGIIKKYSNELKFFEYTPIEIYNKLLESNGYKPVPVGGRLLHDAIILAEKSLEDVHAIRSVIGTNMLLRREKIINEISGKNNGCCIINGEPGVGKSAVVRNYLMEYNIPVFFFKATEIKEKILESLGIINCFSMYEQREVIVVIDAVEKVFDMMDEENFIKVIKALISFDNIKLIISVRSYSLEALKKVLLFDCNFSDFESVSVKSLDAEEFVQIEKNYPEIKIISASAKELIKNLFYLDIIIKEKLIGNLANICNEFQIKDLIWDTITNNNTSVKKTLIELACQKLETKREYVEINIGDAIEVELTNKQIIEEKETYYRFAHDKFQDIAEKKMFDSWYFKNDMQLILMELKDKLSYSRAYKNWIFDRLSNGEIEIISKELENLYQNNDVSYVWKWNTLESILKSSSFDNFLRLNKEKIKTDRNFIKKIYEVSITTNSVELGKGINAEESLKRHFDLYVKPSIRLVNLISFFCNNMDCINDNNKYYVVKVLEESIKLLPIFNEKLVNLLPDVMTLLIKLVEEERKMSRHFNENITRGIIYSFIYYSPYFIDKSKDLLQKIIREDNCVFDNDFIEAILVLSNNSDELIILPEEFIAAFYDDIVRIYEDKSICAKDATGYRNLRHGNEGIYDINESLEFMEPHSFRTQIYSMFKVDFERTLEFVIEFINKKCALCYINGKRPQSNRTSLIDFKFKYETREIYLNWDQYFAYRGGTSVPSFLESMLMSLERILLEKTEYEDISAVLEKLILSSNNFMLIGIAMSIIIKDYKKYGLLFIDLMPNYYMRELENQRYLKEKLEQYISFPTRDYLEKLDREKFNKLPHRKVLYDDVLISIEQIEKYSETVFLMIDRLKEELNEGDEKYVDKYNFLHTKDLREFVCTGKVDANYIFEAKVIEREDVQDKLKEEKKYFELDNEYIKFSNMLMTEDASAMDKKEAEEFIKNYNSGKYNSVNKFEEEELKIAISAFYIFHPELLTPAEYENEIESCIEKALEIVSNELRSSGKLIIRFTKLILSLNDYYLNKYYDDILYFFFSYFVKCTFHFYGLREVTSLLRGHDGCANKMIARLVKLLIKYLENSQQSFEIQKRMSAGENIRINELSEAEDLHLSIIFEMIKSGKEPDLSNSKGYSPDRMNIVYLIAFICTTSTWELVSATFLELLKQIQLNKDEKWISGAALAYEAAISEFIVYGVNNRMLPRKLLDFLYNNITMFHKIIGDVIDTLSAYVQDGFLEVETGWAFVKETFSELEKYQDQANMLTSGTNGFIKNIEYRDLGHLLESSLLSNSKWINQLKPDKIRIFEGNEKEYLDLIIKFAESPIALRSFAKNLADYPDQFDCISIFDYYELLLKAMLNPDTYNEPNLQWYWEIAIELVYKKYNELNSVDRDRFYELLTTIGCNAPSSFALFLRQKIEY